MVEIAGRPILYWIIRWLKRYQVDHLVLAVGYRKERIIDFIKENDGFGMRVDFSEDQVPDGGTAHAFRLAAERFIGEEDFIGMNSDELTDMDLSRLAKAHEQRRPLVTMALAPFYCRFSVVQVSGESRVTDFEYGKRLPTVPVSMGVYAFSREAIGRIPDRGSIEDDMFHSLSKEGGNRIIGEFLREGETWVSVNTQKDIEEATAFVRRAYPGE